MTREEQYLGMLQALRGIAADELHFDINTQIARAVVNDVQYSISRCALEEAMAFRPIDEDPTPTPDQVRFFGKKGRGVDPNEWKQPPRGKGDLIAIVDQSGILSMTLSSGGEAQGFTRHNFAHAQNAQGLANALRRAAQMIEDELVTPDRK